jgi:hypothetical protein
MENIYFGNENPRNFKLLETSSQIIRNPMECEKTHSTWCCATDFTLLVLGELLLLGPELGPQSPMVRT